jgi:hypothetical protein
MKTIYKSIFSVFITGIFLLFAIGSGESDKKVKIDINDQQALEKYIQGKWSWEKHTGDINHTWRYRFEINGNKLKIWTSFNNTDDPFDMSGGYEELNFTLGSPTRDVDGYKARFLEFALFDKTNFFGLTYEGLSPFWLVSDDNWDTPVLRCGSGIPSWSREEFQTTGNKILHSESNSNTYETTTASDYSTLDNSWDPFLVEFRTALVNKDKEKIISMTDELNFFDGGGGATALEFLNDADINKESGWSNLIHSIESGVKGENEKQTVGDYPNLYFIKKNNKWYWQGIVGD